MANLSISVVMPVYNEADTVHKVIQKVVEQVQDLKEIILVDDCSSDATPQRIAELCKQYQQVVALRHEHNQGKTAALRTGFARTTGDVVIVQDADLEYDPAEINDVVRPILHG